MVDFNCCDHECACRHNGHLEAAQQYSSILSKVMSKNADSEYVSKEDKNNWNNKADKDLVDLIKVMVEKHEERLDDLEDGLDEKIRLILYDLGFGDNLLAKYATIEYVNDLIAKIKNDEIDLSKYALKSDLDSIKNDIQNKIDKLTTEITNIKINGGKDYSIESMTYDGEYLVLRQKNGGQFTVSIASGKNPDTSDFVTKSQLASELTKYAKINKLKKIRVKGNVYSLYGDGDTIDIPTGEGSGGGGDHDDSNKYQQAFFQNKNSNTVAPAVPETGKGPSDYQPTDERSKWVINSTNPNKGYYTWMTFAFISNGVYGSWTSPVCITGKDGEAGTDIAEKEQIYKTAGEGETVQKPANNENVDDYVPEGWTDNPQGVSSTVPCEWTCIRTKNTSTGKWNDWEGPILWAHYGHNGTDGDGVEYIFWAGTSEQAYPASEPNSWYNDEQSKNNEYDSNGQYSEEDHSDEYYNSKYYNKREFIKAGTGWKDEPIDLSASGYGPGSKQYVSIRKRRNDSNNQSSEAKDAYWHQYSEPALWSYYAQDGDAGRGVSLNLDNGTMAVSLNNDGTNQMFDQTCTARFYNGTSTISINDITCEIFNASGTKVETDAGLTISTTSNSVDPNCKDIRIQIDNNKLSFNDGGYTIKVAAKASVTGEETTRYATIQLIGVNFGEDGVSYRLNLSSTVVKVSRGNRYPSTIDVRLCKTRGADSIQLIPVSQITTTDSRWKFKYSIDNNTEEVLSADTINSSLISSAENTIRVELDFNNMLVDTETIVIVKDGIDGTNGISYSIDTKSDNVIGKYSGDDISYSGKVEFYVTKIISNVSSEYLDTNDVTVKAYLGGIVSNETEVQYDQSSHLWSINVNNTTSAFVLISVTEKSTGMFYTSSVIPFITPGKDGSYSAPQTLKGGPLRMRGTWVSGTEYFDGTVATSDGIMYQDVVVYNNVYYVCLNSEELRKNNWLSTPSSVSYWQQIAFSDSFISEYLIANKGFIKEFSSEEVVIMDGNEIVAGMTSSKSLTNSLLPSGTIKDDVRIWAGGMRNASDLRSAPFTVTNAGVLKCQGTSGNSITLKDGTIYFVVNGITYHLGVTNGKPDWINSDAADSTETWYQKRGSDTNLSFSQVGTFAIKDNKYYTDATMKTPVSGTYYKKVDNSTILYQVGIYTFLTYGYLFGVEVYNKASFTNGTKNMQGTVAITGSVYVQTIPSQSPSGEIGGTLNVITTNKSWAKISKVDKPTGSFTYYIADTSGSSSGSIPYTRIEQDGVTFNHNTNNGIYVMSASDTESPNLSSTLSGWFINHGTGSSDVVYEIRNKNLTEHFLP